MWRAKRMTLRNFFNLGLLCVAGGALFAEEPVNANPGKKRIVVLGDSITAGYGLDPQQAQLEEISQCHPFRPPH